MTGLLIGKGVSFDAGVVKRVNADLVMCVNHAALHVPGRRMAVWTDERVGREIAHQLPFSVPKWCPERMAGDVLNAVGMRELHPMEPEWQGIDRREARARRVWHQGGFSSTAGLWVLWMLGCSEVITCGIGDAGGYAPEFEGEPACENQGQEAWAWLEQVALVKGVRLTNEVVTGNSKAKLRGLRYGYHCTTPKKLARYEASGRIIAPVRFWPTLCRARRWGRRTGRTIILRIEVPGVAYPLPDHKPAMWCNRDVVRFSRVTGGNCLNSCRRCGGEMKPGKVLIPGIYGSADFGGDFGEPGTTMSEGPGDGKRRQETADGQGLA